MNAEQVPPPVAISLTQVQLSDFALLLAKCLGRGNISWLASAALGPAALQQAGNDVGDINAFASRIVQALDEAGCIPKTVELLFKEGHRNGLLTLGVRHILSGKRLNSDEALQAFVNDYEPFLNNAAMIELLPRVGRRVCAVALLGEKGYGFKGTGFLIAPDLVLTCFHVVEPFLIDSGGGEFIENEPGDQLLFFFDYMMAPPPSLKAPDKEQAVVCVKAVMNKWLLKARGKLSGDGTDYDPKKFTNEYDYAVIRLERPIGKESSRRSGGAIRGWLPPQDTIDVLSKQRRIILFQHPGKVEQQIDIGEYVQLDPTSSRVWYTVSAARGSSGGAAVDSDGTLFALHNAEVKVPVAAANGKPVNQGVRIDRIVQDLAKAVSTEAPDESSLFWSLSDDMQDPHPIIGRTAFIDAVKRMGQPNTERVLVVTGPPASGLQFSIKLLRRTLGRNVPVAVFSPKQLQEVTPQVFLRSLVENLGIGGMSGRPMPELLSTENVPRWLRLDLPKWLLEALTTDEKLNRSKYPAWVVINTVVPQQESFLWADLLRDLIATLVGTQDPGSPGTDLPQLRWLFLAKDPDASANAVPLPVAGVKQLADDLNKEAKYLDDYTVCLQTAWRSNNKNDYLSAKLLETLGRMTLNENIRLPQERRLPIRKALANNVRELIKTSLLAGGG